MPGYFIRPDAKVRFNQEKAAKEDLFAGGSLFLGLNCFEPGQAHPVHTHAGADKFYWVISGRATIEVGTERQRVEAGMLVWAPSDVPHGVSEVLERTVLLVGMAPPPNQPRSAVQPNR